MAMKFEVEPFNALLHLMHCPDGIKQTSAEGLSHSVGFSKVQIDIVIEPT